MRTTTKSHPETKGLIALDTSDLMQALSCGRATAVQIGTRANARIQIGKRVLWNTEKIRNYLEDMEVSK